MPESLMEELFNLEASFKGDDDSFIRAIEEIQKNRNLSIKDDLVCEVAKARFYLFRGSFGKATTIINKVYKKAKVKNVPLAQIDALILRFYYKWMLGDFNYPQLWELIEESENLLKDVSEESQEDIEFRRSNIDFEKACIYRNIGDIDLSLKYCIKTLEACKKDKRLTSLMPTVLMELGKIYYVKGELTKSQDYLLQSLPLLSGNGFGTRVAKIYGLWDLGDNYRAQGKLDLAIEVLEQALEMSSNINIPIYTNVVYNSLIEVYIDKNSLDEARKYLKLQKEYNADRPGSEWVINISEARILKATRRIQNLAEAEKMLRQFLPWIQSGGDLNISASILIDLCEILLIELQITDDVEILNELDSFILQLLEIAEKQHSYTTLTSTKLLQGKIALIQLNTAEARTFFREAQQIADDHGLQKLALSISREHDKLLDQLDIWDDLIKNKAPISERLKLASMDKTIEYLKAKRALDSPQLVSETPTILLILSEGGVMTFSYTFESESKFDEEIFGSFLTAFNSFSDEFFSQGLDRAKFGEDMILMQSVDTFLVCYLFKGETYFALKKLNQFAEDIQTDTNIWETLNNFSKTNQVVEIKDVPPLESLISEIFID
ncbi:MAG: tetratricopeptide repeat protein [Candidatus Hodarchaeales archaeon]|jgi:tetratricopeptide (TPR) repeat protein